jgi:hypothetical protein
MLKCAAHGFPRGGSSGPAMRQPRRSPPTQVYARKTGSFEKIYNADHFGDGTEQDDEYNDESALDSNNGYRSQVTATGLSKNASLGAQPLWDSSPLRHTPYGNECRSPCCSKEHPSHADVVTSALTTGSPLAPQF